MIISLFWCLYLFVYLYLLFIIMMTFILHCSAYAILYLVLIHLSSSIFLSNYLSIYPSHTLVNIIWIRYEHMSLLFHLLIFCRFVYIQQWKSIIPCPVINKPPHRISSHIVFIPHWRCVSTVCCVCYYLYLSSHSEHSTRSAAILSQRDFKSSRHQITSAFSCVT